MLRMRMTLKDGEGATSLYRIAWYDYPRRRAVCYPVGIHWIAWAARWLWMWTYRQTWPDAWERACGEILEHERQASRAAWEHTEAEWKDHLAELRADKMRLQQETTSLRAKLEDMRRELERVRHQHILDQASWPKRGSE